LCHTAKELSAVQILPYNIYGILPMAAKGRSMQNPLDRAP